MKKYLILWLLLCLALTLPAAAEDAEAECYREIGPVVDALLDPPVFYAETGEVPYWDADVDCYGDVLSGSGKSIYLELESRFAAHVAGTKAIPLEMINFDSGPQLAWVLTSAVGKDCASSTARDQWLNEAIDMASDALRAFIYDHPEYFWVREHYGVGYYISGNYAAVDIYYIAQQGFDDLEAQREEINATVAELTDAVKGLSDAEKVAWWDNWLAVNNRYNGDALAENYVSIDATPWSVIGSLTDDHQPVCEGYAKALQLLCHEADIPCVQMSGLANGGGHMWTAVKLEGEWYFCDPTWDDPGRDDYSAGYSCREYLLTVQPYSHSTQYYPTLGLPALSDTAYGFPMAESFGWSADTDCAPLGYEVGTGTMIIALYDGEGRFLTMDACDSMIWDWRNSIYLAPEFSDEVLEQAAFAVRFNLRDTVNWVPAANAAPIE